MKIVNNSVEYALDSLGYSKGSKQRILSYALGSCTLDGDTPVSKESLLKKGVSKASIANFEKYLLGVTDINMAIRADLLSVEEINIWKEHLAKGLPLLKVLGYSNEEIYQSNLEICGRQTVEGSVDLKEEHLPIFDTANYCGVGRRVIHWKGHVKALAAVAPHLSGSASKTVNLPNNATVFEIQEAYELCYKLGVKAAAVYRDGSKLSQVLHSATSEKSEDELLVNLKHEIKEGQSPSSFYHGTTPPKFRLPAMRFGPTWKINVGGTVVFLRANQYDDGSLGEIFIDLSKEGSTLKGVLSCFAISISQGLQHGVPLAKFVETFTFHNFAPQGVVTGHANLKIANSIIDAIFRILAYHYLGRKDLVQNPSEEEFLSITNVSGKDSLPLKTGTALELITASSNGDTCIACGGVMVKSGTCSRCLNCGETSGCS